MKKLSYRLSKIASFVDKGSFVSDVGSDHGALPIYLTNEGIVDFIEAIENKIGPFNRLKKAIEEEAIYLDKIHLSLSDGISLLDKRVNTLILAGMGGRLIASILTSNKENLANIETLIIDAHSERDFLLKELAKLSFKVVDEAFFYEENIPYFVWKLKKSELPILYSQEDYLLGVKERYKRSSDFLRFVDEKIEGIEKILANDNLPSKKKEELNNHLNILKEAKNEH